MEADLRGFAGAPLLIALPHQPLPSGAQGQGILVCSLCWLKFAVQECNRNAKPVLVCPSPPAQLRSIISLAEPSGRPFSAFWWPLCLPEEELRESLGDQATITFVLASLLPPPHPCQLSPTLSCHSCSSFENMTQGLLPKGPQLPVTGPSLRGAAAPVHLQLVERVWKGSHRSPESHMHSSLPLLKTASNAWPRQAPSLPAF